MVSIDGELKKHPSFLPYSAKTRGDGGGGQGGPSPKPVGPGPRPCRPAQYGNGCPSMLMNGHMMDGMHRQLGLLRR